MYVKKKLFSFLKKSNEKQQIVVGFKIKNGNDLVRVLLY